MKNGKKKQDSHQDGHDVRARHPSIDHEANKQYIKWRFEHSALSQIAVNVLTAPTVTHLCPTGVAAIVAAIPVGGVRSSADRLQLPDTSVLYYPARYSIISVSEWSILIDPIYTTRTQRLRAGSRCAMLPPGRNLRGTSNHAMAKPSSLHASFQ